MKWQTNDNQQADTSSETVGGFSGSSPPVSNGTYGDVKNPWNLRDEIKRLRLGR